MNAKDLFAVAVRVIGLLSFGRGFNDLLYVALNALHLTSKSVLADGAYYSELVYGIFYFFAGLYFIRGAPLIVDYAFPHKSSEMKTPDNVNAAEIERDDDDFKQKVDKPRIKVLP